VTTRIVVVGAGIGGLTAALALARAGVRCTVFERHRSLPGTGGGIQIPPNAALILDRLGVAPADAVRPVARELRRWRDDTLIGRVELGAAAEQRYGAPYSAMRRAVLCRALYAAVRRELGPDAVTFGRRCVALDDRGDDVVARFDDGTTLTAGAVVGADGVHSTVRGLLGGPPARYAGHVAYRAILPACRTGPAAAPAVVVRLGPGRHCVTYPVGSGGDLNLVATVPAPTPPGAAREVAPADVLAAYPGWHPTVRGLIARADRLERRLLFDCPAPGPWHRGRVVLLGDAAHPMLPFVAQGAAQAIEDAATLAGRIGEPDGLARYEADRRDRAERVAAAARAGAHDHHLPDGPAQRERDAHLAAAALSDLDWLYRGLAAR
jgi:salicylate hydroxylase